ncbi:MAG: prolyl oligopeptidase family serine peptidase [Candidatus Latescibacteria bacterium]|nr:prolyl oligopeptidase family serine peptidase [Candidatus Latescibacterota bacterium]
MKVWLWWVLAWLCGCAAREADPSAPLRQALQIPVHRGELTPQLVKTWNQRDLVFEQIRFRGRDELWVEALACYSELARSRPLPALLCIPGSGNRKEELVQPLDLMPDWADRGFFVLSIDRVPDEAGLLERQGLAGIWGHQVHQLIRSLDYLQTRPEVDGKRIGMLGLSMGGMEALWLAALDQRVKVVVSVAGHLAWSEIFAGEAWRLVFAELPLGRRLLASAASGEQAWQAFRRSYPQLPDLDAGRVAAQLAPRPLLLLTGEHDPYSPPTATRQVFSVAVPAYEAKDQAAALEMWVEPEAGHGFSLSMRNRALAWFRRWL